MLELHNPEATASALAILRDGSNFQWYVIFILVLVLYIYFSEVQKKNWKGIAAGMMLYSIHWFVEIINAYFQYFSGHALWTVPTGTAFLLLIGVGVELSLMFSIAGLAVSKLLPEDPNEKMFGISIPNRFLIGMGNAALASVIEIFLVTTPIFVWVHEWWNALTVFVLVYIPFFVGATYAYDWDPKRQILVIGMIFVLDAALFIPGILFGMI